MRDFLKFFIILFFGMQIQHAAAIETIEILGGKANQIPIAVTPFDEQTLAAQKQPQKINQIIENDLIRSGLFDILNTGGVSSYPRNVDEVKIFVHKNGVVLDNFNSEIRDESIFNEHPELRNKKIIAYIGTHGLAHGLSFIIESIPQLVQRKNNAHFLFIGEGAEKEGLIKISEELCPQNVTFLPIMSKKEVIKYLSIIDVGLVNLIKSDVYKTVIPSKIFEIAAMQKPILLGVEGESKMILENYKAGICFEPENPNDFIEKCCYIIENSEGFQQGSMELAESHDRKKIALKMLNNIIN